MGGPADEEHISDPVSREHKSWIDSASSKPGSGWGWGLACGVLITGFGLYLVLFIRVNRIAPTAPIYPASWIVLASGILVLIASFFNLRRKLAETR